jgi:5'-nucleotidase
MMSSQPILVLTNDDGVDAPGLSALVAAAAGLGRCRVIAPSGPYSGCGHQTTTHGPIRISEREGDRIAVCGTPVDCVRLAIHSLATDLAWVIAGVNSGGNLGTDLHHSGTVASVREAAIRGIPGIAVSHYIARGRAIDWGWAARTTSRVLELLMSRRCEPGSFWNVNLPHPLPGSPDPDIVDCPLDPSPLPLDYQVEDNAFLYTGDYQRRSRCPGADVATCFDGQISVTLIRVSEGQADLSPGGETKCPGVPGEKASL